MEIIRPRDLTPESEKWQELEHFLVGQWQRALTGRSTQVDSKYSSWNKNYYAIPLESKRNFPWPNSSNIVIPLSRIFIDTFIARSLNIIFATRPLYVPDGFPSLGRAALEQYLNRKARYEWNHYRVAKDFMFRGCKNGTAIIKTLYEETRTIDVRGEDEEEDVLEYAGPRSTVIPFEDFYVYPITANYLDEVVIKFHRIRAVEELARQKVAQGLWQLTDEELEEALVTPADVKRQDDQTKEGTVDSEIREAHIIECNLKYAITNDKSRYYDIIGVITENGQKLVDVYYNPNPRNTPIYREYKPFPKEDLFFGESMCELIAPFQEEVTTIHNDRRNNSTLANTVNFKRRSGAMIPNPTASWYPGKCWDLEAMDDLDVLQIGRNYSDMLQEETFSIQLAERLLGIGQVMQGMGGGQMEKRGVYNTGGTLGVLSESNQRQDTNIRDVREVLGLVARDSFLLQKSFRPNDETINVFPEKLRGEIQAAFQAITEGDIARSYFEVRTSDAGANKEVNKRGLLELAQTLGQYGTTVQAMSMQVMNPQLNPGLRKIMLSIVNMHKWMATRLLRAYDELDGEEIIPDVEQAIAEQQQQQQQQPSPMGNGGGPQQPMPGRNMLEAIANLPGNGQSPSGGGGMAMPGL